MKEWTEKELISEGYKIQNALITNVDLSTENYCAACLQLTIEGNGWGVCYGGYKLGYSGTYIERKDIEGNQKGFEAILNIMWVLDSDSVVGLKGKYIRVATKNRGDTITIIGHIIKDQWFDYSTFFEE